MKRIFIVSLICLLFTYCNKKKETITPNRDSYIISYEDKKIKNHLNYFEES